MQIVAALFADDLDVRQRDGPSTRLDLRGIKFSEAAAGPFPVRIEPHLFVIVRCAPGDSPDAVLEVRFLRSGAAGETGGAPDGEPGAEPEQVARNVQPLQIEPGKYAYRLVRAELEFDAPGTIEAHCSIDRGEPVVVPFTMLPAAPGAPAAG
jgi:hypothetical protein